MLRLTNCCNAITYVRSYLEILSNYTLIFPYPVVISYSQRHLLPLEIDVTIDVSRKQNKTKTPNELDFKGSVQKITWY